MHCIVSILLALSIYASISSIFLTKNVLDSINCPIFFVAFINILHFIIYRTIKCAQRSHYPNFNIKRSEIWLFSFTESISQIFLILNLKYNTVILFQISKLMMIPCILFILLFVASLNQTTSDRESSINSILSFILIVIGLIIYITNNQEISFSPGLIIAFLSILLQFISIFEKIRIIIDNKIINEKSIKLYIISNNNIGLDNLNSQFLFPKTIISLVLAIIFDLPSMYFKKFSILNQKADLSILAHNFLYLVAFKIYGDIYSYIDNNSSNTSSILYCLIYIIGVFGEPFIVIYIAYNKYTKYQNSGLAMIVFIMGYFLYCFFEIKNFYNEIVYRNEENHDNHFGRLADEETFNADSPNNEI